MFNGRLRRLTALLACVCALAPAARGQGASDPAPADNSAGATAWSEDGPWPYEIPHADARALSGETIGRITIEVVDVYDPRVPKEGGRFGRVVNAIHINSRRRIVRRELLFREGDLLDPEHLEQTARNLRALGVFAHAEVVAMPPGPDGRVPVHIRVQDGWSLQIGGSFGRSGGANRYEFGVQEENFLGQALKLSYERKVTFARTEQRYSFLDRRFRGRPEALRLAYSRLENGKERQFAWEHDFLSIDDPLAYRVSAGQTNERFHIYENGESAHEYDSNRVNAEALFERKIFMPAPETAWRAGLGLYYAQTAYDLLATPRAGDAEMQPTATRRMGPLVVLERVANRYVAVPGLYRPGRVEDINLGDVFNLTARLGTGPGSEDHVSRIDTDWSRGWQRGPGRLSTVLLKLGQYAGGERNATDITVQLRRWRLPRERRTDALLFEARATTSASPLNFLYLGGSPGLRGFKENQFRGTRSLLVVAESRRYSTWTPLRFFQPGLVYFAEAGSVWGGPGAPLNRDALHGDIGVGLRIAQIKASGLGIIKTDFAIPVGPRPPGAARYQVTVGFRSDF